MRILADDNMPAVAELFGDHASAIERAPGREITPAHLRHTDILLVRSVTQVTPDLLQGSPVGFVGSATIGTDHVDRAALAVQSVGFAHAPGCNADSVVDYVLAALCEVFADDPDSLAGKSVAVVGAGQVGGRLFARLRAIGLSVVVHDPPRQAVGKGPGPTLTHSDYVTLDDAFGCDIVCCHTPLTVSGQHPTKGLIDIELVRRLPLGSVVLNAGRGAVIPDSVIRHACAIRPDIRWVLDVWESEPDVPGDLVQGASLATGHIAGYALDGKIRGTWMLRRAIGHWAGWLPPEPLVGYLPPERNVVIRPAESASVWSEFAHLIRCAYPLLEDHRRFRAVLQSGEPGAFDQYRKFYPERREFNRLSPLGVSPEAGRLLTAAGFPRVAQKPPSDQR